MILVWFAGEVRTKQPSIASAFRQQHGEATGQKVAQKLRDSAMQLGTESGLSKDPLQQLVSAIDREILAVVIGYERVIAELQEKVEQQGKLISKLATENRKLKQITWD